MKDDLRHGRVTLPMDNDVKVTREVAEKWGADAIRDCDGTLLNDEIIALGKKVYKTYFVSRGDNAWGKSVPEEAQHFFILSERFTAESGPLSIELTKGYFTEQIEPDFSSDALDYLEVTDRTEGVKIKDYKINGESGTVVIADPVPFHEYTVSYLARVKWDSTQMYNYITNNWTKEKEVSYDPRYPKTEAYIVEHMKTWLDENKDIDVVRFTTFIYHFTLLFNNKKKEKFVDWFGYSASVSPKALKDFEKEYGYRLTAEDIVDEGYFNSPFRVPSKAYKDYMRFIQKFVANTAKKLVDVVHAKKREAMMFLGDTWIGAEPYGQNFKDIGLDAIVGSVGGGVTVRMLSDVTGVRYTEGRFLPYFFPDTFYEGNDPTVELNKNWLTARRAIMRNPIDRIGYGGYLSLANKFPAFIDRVSEIADEFRKIYSIAKKSKPVSRVKVAILNAWGKIRSWQCFMVAHELWYKQIYSYQGILESLSGMDVDVSFISFDDVLEGGALNHADVIINAGDAYTAFSGGEYWTNPELIAKLRAYVHAGGGFIGVGEPAAFHKNGRFFQLADVLGVEKEQGFTLSHDKYNTAVQPHFITEALKSYNYGEGINNVYAIEGAEVLAYDKGNVTMAVNSYGKGKAFYCSGLPYSPENSDLLRRAIFELAGKRGEFYEYYADSPFVETHVYSDGTLAIVNNSNQEQDFNLYDTQSAKSKCKLKAGEIVFKHI